MKLGFCCTIFLLSQVANAQPGRARLNFKPEIEPYVSFIKKQHTDPISYLLDKYKRYDVIVFGERDH